MKKFRLVQIGLLALALAIILWQRERIGRSQTDNPCLRATIAEMEQLRAKNERLSKAETNSDELERLRKEHSELLRLRGEISRLREQMKSRPSNTTTSEIREAPAVESPVEIFTANVEANVSPGQTIITGGWDTGDGKKTFLFVQSYIIDEQGNEISAEQAKQKAGRAQIVFQTKFAEGSKESLHALGLDNLLPGNNESEHFVMNEAESRLLFQKLDGADGDILSAPRITTLNGRQAQVSVLDERTIDNQKYYLGPAVDLTPQVSPDGRSIKTTLHATLTRENRRK